MKKYKTLQQLFSDKKRWTRHAEARNKYGNPVKITSKNAVKWCMLGGIELVYPNDIDTIKYKVRNRVVQPIANWNDYYATFESIKKICKELKI